MSEKNEKNEKIGKTLQIDIDISNAAAQNAVTYLAFLNSDLYQKQLPMLKILSIYRALDDFLPTLAAKATCKAGCAWCCKIPVELMPIEARLITRGSGIQMTPKKQRKKFTGENIDYCPLLDRVTMQCKVYKYRPFNCRAFFSFEDPELCRTGSPVYSTGGPKNKFGSEYIFLLAKELIQIEIGFVPGLSANTLRPEDAPRLKRILNNRVHDIRTLYGTKPR